MGVCVYTQSHKYRLTYLFWQRFQAMLSRSSLSAFSVSDCTLVLMFAVLLGRGCQHWHPMLSPVTLVLVIELCSSVAFLWWRCPLLGWDDTSSAVVQLLILPDLVVPQFPRVPWVTPSYNNGIHGSRHSFLQPSPWCGSLEALAVDQLSVVTDHVSFEAL